MIPAHPRVECMHDWKSEVDHYADRAIEVGAIWSKGRNLHDIVKDLTTLARGYRFNSIATVETRGLVFAAPLSAALGVPLLLFRKRGRIAHTEDKLAVSFANWRGHDDGMEIECELLADSRQILVVDDLVDKANTCRALLELVTRAGSAVVAFVCFANISGVERIGQAPIRSLLG
jgi:adenine/guanine phosphoribosyltransferase-like PRPP-binding protein